MEAPVNHLVFHATPHPDARVHRAGFDLDSAYLERCWLPIVGPSSVLMLRRMPQLWERGSSVAVPVDELANALGLGGATGRHSPVMRTVDRLVRFRFAAWSSPSELDVYTEAAPLPHRYVDRLPASVRETHDQLLERHLQQLGLLPPADINRQFAERVAAHAAPTQSLAV